MYSGQQVPYIVSQNAIAKPALSPLLMKKETKDVYKRKLSSTFFLSKRSFSYLCLNDENVPRQFCRQKRGELSSFLLVYYSFCSKKRDNARFMSGWKIYLKKCLTRWGHVSNIRTP